jgi:predicted ATP-grasp superfamily ATP-dependent carboligase
MRRAGSCATLPAVAQLSDVVLYEDFIPDQPTLVLAYAGWSDGGEAATTALRYLIEKLDIARYARIEMDEFLDFTVVRPQVRLRAAERREIVWPHYEFFAVALGGPDLLLGIGVEPHLRWRRYAQTVVALARKAEVRRVILLGAYLDDVLYSQPTQVRVSASDPALVPELQVQTPSYEGPTGITGVLADAFRREQLACLSLWAPIPHYVPAHPNSRAALALLERLVELTELAVDLAELKEQAAKFDATVSELIANDPQLSAYVRELKRRVFTQ